MKLYKYLTCSCRKAPRRSNCISTDIISSSTVKQSPITSRCFILGLRGSGKSTFLCRARTGRFRDTQPTEDYDFQEIPLTNNQIVNFTEVAGSDRRNLRLHFLHLAPSSVIGVLFFIDVVSGGAEVINALGELVYALMYARSRECQVSYLGVVLNKQDLLSDHQRGLEVMKGQVREAMKELLSQEQYAQLGVPLRWEVFGDGVSTKTGVGVGGILESVGAGMAECEQSAEGDAAG